MLLNNAHLLDRDGTWDIGLLNGRIASVGPSCGAPTDAAHVLDLEGRLLLPAFVDAHLHLDKAYLNDDPQLSGRVADEFFAALKTAKASFTHADISARMERALRLAGAHGTGAIRAQVDVDDVVGLRGLEAALDLKQRVAAWLDLQIVAFPQEGLVQNPRATALMREALRLGADVVGGGATFDGGRIEAHIDCIFGLATEFNCDVDLHADLATPPQAPLCDWELAHIIEATVAAGWQGRVTVAHLTQLGKLGPGCAATIASAVSASGINVTVVPCAEINTASTWDTPPATSVDDAMTRLDVLLSNDVNLSYATGHVADPFSPFGCADMLLDGLVLACARNLGGPRIDGRHILELGTGNPARALRREAPYTVDVGGRADLVCLDATDPDAALRQHANIWLQLRGGSIWPS